MVRKSNIMSVTVLAGVALLLGQGCSSKGFRSMVGNESMDSNAEYAEKETGQRDPHSGYLQDGTWDVSQLPNGGYQQDGVWDVAQGRFVRPDVGGENSLQDPGGFPPLKDDSKNFDESMALLPDYGTGIDQPGNFEEGGPVGEEFVQNNMVAEAQPSMDQGPYSNGSSDAPNYPVGTQGFPEGTEEGPGSQGTIQIELQDVFFQLDSWNVSQDGAQALVHDATWLAENNERSLTVEGHCDQRGTGDYNMALGQKRAEAVRTYLMDLGVSVDQVRVVSYGKERPFCFGSDEQCMQLNRRGHLNLHNRQ